MQGSAPRGPGRAECGHRRCALSPDPGLAQGGRPSDFPGRPKARLSLEREKQPLQVGKGASQHRLDRAPPVPVPRAGAGPKERAGRLDQANTSSSSPEPTWPDETLGWEHAGSAMPSEVLWPSSKQQQRCSRLVAASAFHVLLPFKVMTKSSRKMATQLVPVPETELFIVLNYSVCI